MFAIQIPTIFKAREVDDIKVDTSGTLITKFCERVIAHDVISSISICNCIVTLQNGNEVNRETLAPQAASSVCDSAKHYGLVTMS